MGVKLLVQLGDTPEWLRLCVTGAALKRRADRKWEAKAADPLRVLFFFFFWCSCAAVTKWEDASK